MFFSILGSMKIKWGLSNESYFVCKEDLTDSFLIECVL